MVYFIKSKSYLWYLICLSIYFLLISYGVPLYASYSSNEEDDSKKKFPIHKQEGQLTLAIKGMIEDSSKEVVSMGSTLLSINKDIKETLAFSELSTDILLASDTVRKNTDLSKERLSRATSKLEQIDQVSMPSLIKKSSLGKIKTLESLDTFLVTKGINVSWGQDASTIQSMVHNNHISSPSFRILYSGWVNYSGTTKYNNSQKAQVWDCGYCKDKSPSKRYTNNLYSSFHGLPGPARCIGCGYKHSQSDMNPFIHEIDIPHQGTISYKGNEQYEGAVECKDHHDCTCADWAEVILSFREVLAEKDFYKKNYKHQKENLDLAKKAYEDIKDVKGHLDTAEEVGNKTLMKLQNERLNMRTHIEKIDITAQLAAKLINGRESYQNTILNLVSQSEVEQRSERNEIKIKLDQKEIDQKEQAKQTREDLNKQAKQTREDLNKKDETIQSSHVEVRKVLEGKVDEEKQAKQEIVQSLTHQYDLEKKIAMQEALIRSMMPKLFNKLCIKAQVKKEDRANYLSILRNKELSIVDLLGKVDEFMEKDDFE